MVVTKICEALYSTLPPSPVYFSRYAVFKAAFVTAALLIFSSIIDDKILRRSFSSNIEIHVGSYLKELARISC